MKKVRIYGTAGPACADEKTLEAMLREGMDGIRLNLSHSSLADAAGMLSAYRRAAEACGARAELLIDMQGPELRMGPLDAPVGLCDGALIGTDELPFPREAAEALSEAPAGQGILLDDGKLLLEKEASGLLRVKRGGVLAGRKSVALPGLEIRNPAVTEADRRNFETAGEFGVTAVMQPFVRGGEDLIELRAALREAGLGGVRIMAKTENEEGVNRLGEIVPLCDEIVIARGDLGNSVGLIRLPAVQKRIAEVCRRAGRDFTVVTQMLDSMIERPVPTRAEVGDIFNAVLDGASSVMLTGETAVGKHPVEAIRFMAGTVREAERFLDGM